jgi:secreted trypsin-like serine protease
MKVIVLIALSATLAIAADVVPLVDWSSVELAHHAKDVRLVRERRIHNGNPVEPHSIPYQAAVLTRHAETVGRWGGSLITTRSVLAAAHSFFNPLTEVVVVLGAHYITQLEDSQQRFYVDLDLILRHPDFVGHSQGHSSSTFNHNRNPNDLAILSLPRAAVINDFVQVVRLPVGAETQELFTSELATVSGKTTRKEEAQNKC